MKAFASRLYKQVTHFGLAFLLMVSSLSVLGPLVSSQSVGAAPACYTFTTSSDLGWQGGVNVTSKTKGPVTITLGDVNTAGQKWNIGIAAGYTKTSIQAFYNGTTNTLPTSTTIIAPSSSSPWIIWATICVQAVDTTPPVISKTVTPGPNGYGWNSSNVVVDWTVTDAESTPVLTGCADTTVSSETIASGTTLSCSATSTGGTANDSVTVKLDKTKPTIGYSLTPAGPTNTDVVVSLTCSDALSGIASDTVSGNITVGANTTIDTSTVGTCTDKAGNTATALSIVVDNIDKEAPTASFIFPVAGLAATSFQVQFSEAVKESQAEDPANYFLTNWPGFGGSGDLAGDATIDYNTTTHIATVTFTASGWYVAPEQLWGVEAVSDLAGNVIDPSPTAAYSTPLVNPTAPGVPTTTTPTNQLDINWTWDAATDPTDATTASGVKGYEYVLVTAGDGEPVSGWTFTTTTSAVTTVADEGSYDLYVRAIDNAGNTGVSALGSVTVDTTGPTVSIDSPSHLTTVGNNALVVITGSTGDAVSYELFIGSDPTPVATGSSFSDFNWDTTGLTSGDYTVTLQAVDTAGNSSSDSITITVDNDGPSALITSAGTQNTATPVIGGTVDSDATNLTFYIDGVPQVTGLTWTPGDTTWSFSAPFTTGVYGLQIIAADSFGNQAGQLGILLVTVPEVDTPDDPDTDEDESTTTPQATVIPGDVLGDEDDATDDDQDVAGTSTETPAAADTQPGDGKLFGLAWHWWLLILVSLGAFIWWLVGYLRRRRDNEA